MNISYHSTFKKQAAFLFEPPHEPTGNAQGAAVDFDRSLHYMTFHEKPFTDQEMENFKMCFNKSSNIFPDIDDLNWANNYFDTSQYETAQSLIWDKLLADASDAQKQHWVPYLNAWLHQGGFLNSLNAALKEKALIEGFHLKELAKHPRKANLTFERGVLWMSEEVKYGQISRMENPGTPIVPVAIIVPVEGEGYLLKGKRLQGMRLPPLGRETNVEILPAWVELEYKDPILNFLDERTSAEKAYDEIKRRCNPSPSLNKVQAALQEIPSWLSKIQRSLEEYSQQLRSISGPDLQELDNQLKQASESLLVEYLFHICTYEPLDFLDSETDDIELSRARVKFTREVSKAVNCYMDNHPDLPSVIQKILVGILELLPDRFTRSIREQASFNCSSNSFFVNSYKQVKSARYLDQIKEVSTRITARAA